MPADLAGVFFDTSVLVYMLAEADPRTEKADSLLSEGGVISVQILNEFTNVARRKYAMDWDEIEAALADIKALCDPILPITFEDHRSALWIARRYGYRIYDAMLIAAASGAGCQILYSEDMQHGQKIEGLTIVNPFVSL